MSAPASAAGEAPPSAAAPSARRARLKSLVKLALAMALFALVLRSLPWTDEVVRHRGDAELVVPGEIEGDWKAARIAFVVAPEFAAAREDVPPRYEDLVRGSAAEAGPDGEWFEWRPGMPRVFGGIRPGPLGVALALFLLGQVLCATRWWRLLIAAGCPSTWLAAVRLFFIGLFFNLVMPGVTGGDLVKVVLATREHPERKARAVVSIGVDRLVGLFALVMVAACAVLALGDAFGEIRAPVFGFVLAGTAGALAATSRGLRRLLRTDALFARVPLGARFKEIDDALLVYADRRGDLGVALLLSFLNHAVVIYGTMVIARAFGDALLSTLEYYAAVPIATVVSALPLAPGGWGVGEAAYGFLFDRLGASKEIGVATSVTWRLLQTVWWLAGGLFLLFPGARSAAAEVLASAEAAPPAARPEPDASA